MTDAQDYWADWQVTKKMKCFEYGSRGRIHNNSFPSKVKNGPDNLVLCYIRLKGLDRDKTLKLIEPTCKFLRILFQGLYSKEVISFISLNRPNKLECYVTLGWKGLARANTKAY